MYSVYMRYVPLTIPYTPLLHGSVANKEIDMGFGNVQSAIYHLQRSDLERQCN